MFLSAKEIRAVHPGLLSPFYADDAAFNGLTRRNELLLMLLMKRGPDQGYLPKTSKSLFFSDTPEQEEAAKREFAA